MRWCACFVVVAVASCHGRPPVPQHYVVEGDLGTWKYRRIQKLLDIEVWVDGNTADGYAASYITEDAYKRGKIDEKDVVNVFVTHYAKPDGVLRETVKLARRLAGESGYKVDEDKFGKTRALVVSGHDESWVMWPSDQYFVKIGGRYREDVPKALVASYADRFPSQLPKGSLEGALPAGPDSKPRGPGKEKYDPNNPRPDMEKYDPKKVKIPVKKEKEKEKGKDGE